jgi:hypothetical protein
MIALLPYFLISLFALAMVLSMVLMLRRYRKYISAFEERLQTLEDGQEVIGLTLKDYAGKSAEEGTSNLEERLKILESNQTRIEQTINDQVAKSVEEIGLKHQKLKEDIKAFFMSSIESVLKKTGESATVCKNELDLLSTRIASLEQNIVRRPMRQEKEEPAEPVRQQVAPAQPQAAPIDAANAKARRLARLIVSEIALYNRKSLEEAVRSDTFNQLMEHDIKEARALYARRVPDEILNSTSYLDEAFTELIANTKRELNL